MEIGWRCGGGWGGRKVRQRFLSRALGRLAMAQARCHNVQRRSEVVEEITLDAKLLGATSPRGVTRSTVT